MTLSKCTVKVKVKVGLVSLGGSLGKIANATRTCNIRWVLISITYHAQTFRIGLDLVLEVWSSSDVTVLSERDSLFQASACT